MIRTRVFPICSGDIGTVSGFPYLSDSQSLMSGTCTVSLTDSPVATEAAPLRSLLFATDVVLTGVRATSKAVPSPTLVTVMKTHALGPLKSRCASALRLNRQRGRGRSMARCQIAYPVKSAVAAAPTPPTIAQSIMPITVGASRSG